MRDETPGFWTFFLAFLMALLVHDALRLGFAALGVRLALGALSEAVQTTPGHLPARRTGARSSVPAAVQDPAWPGPITAHAEGVSRACIDGRVADRLNNGWDQKYDEPCRATSP